MQVDSEESTNNYLTTNQIAFKRPRKILGKKRPAEEDIVALLESRNDQIGTADSGLGTKEQK